jgi:hypothetical protein
VKKTLRAAVRGMHDVIHGQMAALPNAHRLEGLDNLQPQWQKAVRLLCCTNKRAMGLASLPGGVAGRESPLPEAILPTWDIPGVQ